MREGRTPLHYAAMSNDVDSLTTLLGQGVNPNIPDRSGFTALHLVAPEGSTQAAAALLDGGADANAVNRHGNTPLFIAVFNSRGRGDLIELLRAHGADPWHCNNAGQTPVSLARLIVNYDVARFFADLGDA
jgi:ankyrin repeat protein